MDRLLTVTSRASWRRWLSRHHANATEIWLIFFKRHTGMPSIAYVDAVEEALCFGWIDSLIQRIDDDRYARKFTPRRSDAAWSASNRTRLAKLIAQGRMTAAGLAKVPHCRSEDPPGTPPAREPSLPVRLRRLLSGNRRAWESFRGLAPSHRRRYVRWIVAAKRPETQERRLRKAIGLLARGEKLGMK